MMAEQPWKVVATAGDRRLAIPPDKDLASGDKDLRGRVLLPDGTIAKEAPVWVLMTWIPFQIGRENEAGQPVNESDDDLPGATGARSKTEGVMNTDDGREPLTKEIRLLVPIEKSEAPAKRVSYGVVLEPDTEDLQGDVMTAEDIEEAAYDWMERSQAGGHMHSETVDGAKVVESYIAPCDIPVETAEGPETIRKGSWVLGMRWPESIWKRITGGELTGYSVGGTGVRLAMEDVDKATLGRMGGPLAAGPDGYCVCPSCGHREAHDTGEPCTELTCPECGAAMAREEPEEVDKAVDLTAQDVSKFARQAFEQVLKAKWAPGPNAGWRRLDAGEDDEENKKPRTYHSDEAGEVTVPEDDDSTPRPEDEERDEELRRTRSEARQKIRRTFEGDYLETDDVTVDCRYAVHAGGGKPKITEPGRYGVFPDAENMPGGWPKNLDSIIWTEPGESLGDLIRRLPNGNYILAS